MTLYIWRNGRFCDKRTGEPMPLPEGNEVCAPLIQSDIAPYQSPLGDYWIDGRRAQREDLKRNDCVISDFPRRKFDPEEYRHRKAQQARELEKRK